MSDAPAPPDDLTYSVWTAPSTDSSAPPATTDADSQEGIVPRMVIGIDSTVQQGNRVTVTTPNLKTDPIGDLKRRIIGHFNEASVIVSELRATVDELDALLNKVRTGL